MLNLEQYVQRRGLINAEAYLNFGTIAESPYFKLQHTSA